MIRSNAKYQIFRAATFAALFAWLALVGQTFAHADHAHHADLPTSHCISCSVAGFDKDDTPLSILSLELGMVSTNEGLAEKTIQPTPDQTKLPRPPARAPPHS